MLLLNSNGNAVLLTMQGGVDVVWAKTGGQRAGGRMGRSSAASPTCQCIRGGTRGRTAVCAASRARAASSRGKWRIRSAHLAGAGAAACAEERGASGSAGAGGGRSSVVAKGAAMASRARRVAEVVLMLAVAVARALLSAAQSALRSRVPWSCPLSPFSIEPTVASET